MNGQFRLGVLSLGLIAAMGLGTGECANEPQDCTTLADQASCTDPVTGASEQCVWVNGQCFNLGCLSSSECNAHFPVCISICTNCESLEDMASCTDPFTGALDACRWENSQCVSKAAP